MGKKISLSILLIAIVLVIWRLESIKASSDGPGSKNNPEAISILSSETGKTSSSETKTPLPARSVQSIATMDVLAGDQPAIEIADPTGFVNASSTFRLKDLIGKRVILVDFWTYSCINCIRTLPYLTSWYQKYKDQGLTIVAIHTPEFDFEKDINNVQAAVKKYGIQYPVVLDSNQGTWRAYGNLYWPHEYLIDIAGYIVHDHIGEGEYDETEANIQKLVEERAEALGFPMPSGGSTVSIPPPNLSGIGSPETYFGAMRNEYLANGNSGVAGIQTLQEPKVLSINGLYLIGTWNFQNEFATNNTSEAKIIYKYHSAKVFFVASSPGITIEVMQDGKPVSTAAGTDVRNGKAIIKESRLYNLINNPDGAGDHTLEIIITSPGLQAYTFTFG